MSLNLFEQETLNCSTLRLGKEEICCDTFNYLLLGFWWAVIRQMEPGQTVARISSSRKSHHRVIKNYNNAWPPPPPLQIFTVLDQVWARGGVTWSGYPLPQAGPTQDTPSPPLWIESHTGENITFCCKTYVVSENRLYYAEIPLKQIGLESE